MGLLDQFAGAMLGGSAGKGPGPELIASVLRALLSQQGGLQGLLERFTSAGLGDQAASWVSTGANLPVSADQLQQALGSDVLGQLATQLGMSAPDAAGSLAGLLPQLIDQLTPDGQVPAPDAVQDGLGKLLGMLGR